MSKARGFWRALATGKFRRNSSRRENSARNWRRSRNAHPSLLPSFPGLEAWKQALDHGVKVTGCTVHFVDAGVDAGPIISQQTVPVLDNDTAESLHARIHAAEHELYPQCVAVIARGEISVVGRKVIWRKP